MALVIDRRHHGGRQRGHGNGHPDAENEEARKECRPVRPADSRQQRQEREPGRRNQRTDDERQPWPDAIRQRARPSGEQ